MAIDFNKFNPQQGEAVRTFHGPLLLLAGAGTGKTMVITHRIAYMVERGVDPAQILAVTFTNKAAKEMRERVGKLVSAKAAKAITLGTFHSFCLTLLRQHAKLLGWSHGFTLADPGDQVATVRQAMARLRLGDGAEGGLDANAFMSRISRAKNRDLRPEDLEISDDDEERLVGRVYRLYAEHLHATDLMDFDDLLQQSVRLLRDFPEVLSACRRHWRYLMVDEFQDTNSIQMALLRLLAAPDNNLCVVGDDDQSIYSWRGAEVENILHFADNFPGCKTIKLEQNYRSTNRILKAANKVIGINDKRHGKNLWSQQGEGEEIAIIRCEHPDKEASMIAQAIKDRLLDKKGKPKDFAILYRSNSQSRPLEDALRRANIPNRVVGDTSFYERAEIKDALAYLMVAVNPRNDQALLRILDSPPRGIGTSTVRILRQSAEDRGRRPWELACDPAFCNQLLGPGQALHQLARDIQRHANLLLHGDGRLAPRIRAYLDEVGYLDGLARMYKPRTDAEIRHENVLEFINGIAEREEEELIGLESFLEKITLAEEWRRRKDGEEEQDAVTLLTVHAAKGLEFPVVFLTGTEQNLFPHERSIKERNIAEERRLFYVAVTRAKRELFISWCGTRRSGHTPQPRRQSQFIGELPEDCIDFRTPDTLVRKLAREESSATLRDLLERFKTQPSAPIPALQSPTPASLPEPPSVPRFRPGKDRDPGDDQPSLFGDEF